MGYMGAAAGDKLTGHLAQDYGWRLAVWFWAGCAFVAALVIACLWNESKALNHQLLYQAHWRKSHCQPPSPQPRSNLQPELYF